MPHKKAKRTVREKLRNEKGEDLAPGKASLQNESIPKSALRVFNSMATREEYRQKKRKNEDDGERSSKRHKAGPDGSSEKQKKNDKKVALKIQPGESIQHFNRRVEDDLRPLVKAAAQSARALERNVQKAEREARIEAQKAKKEKAKAKPDVPSKPTPKEDSPPPPVNKFANRPKEFAAASSAAPKRLNDIAQAPPEFKQLPRGAGSAIGKRDGVLSMSQKVMMEQEREKAIIRYRELKAKRKQAGDLGDKLKDDS
ncbi:hypothetical protein D9613_012086 [Agrocybe pediades]|uniref:Uncharacterized protein n=1 Tax=Agrocybe pediades TaxID=84607 RepID=A0A8H4R240_9AGAR|nr:hypothetical protein D9613_012086 [Agrocybe pediades]